MFFTETVRKQWVFAEFDGAGNSSAGTAARFASNRDHII
jgi:hypothetical protein